jgi:hypothetical protein
MTGSLNVRRPPSKSMPGRIYTMVVVSLAGLLLGLGIDAIRPADGWRPGDPVPAANQLVIPHSITAQRLLRILAVACTCGILTNLIPRGKRPSTRATSPMSIAELTGLPIVGAMYPASFAAPAAPRTKRLSARGLACIVMGAELVVCLALSLTIYACVQRPDMGRQFLRNPMTAYTHSVSQAIQQVIALTPTTSPSVTK